MLLHLNESPRRGRPLTQQETALFGPDGIADVRKHIEPLHFSVTPLHRLERLASKLAIDSVLVKDESSRSSLGSFKALGGAYAVIRVVLAEAERQLGRLAEIDELNNNEIRAIAAKLTVACATDGNHGRSVAAGARSVGCNAVVYLHAGVSEARAVALSELGAKVIRVPGSYDDSVAQVAHDAQTSGWRLVSDTSWEGYERVPSWVMQGYLVISDEILQQCRAQSLRPTHLFLQAGVGGLAAAIAAHVALSMGGGAPRFIVVEPDRAACLFQSAVERKRVKIPPGPPTLMAMLECYEPSLLAWHILEKLAYAFVTIDDAAALRTMRMLAFPEPPDPFVVSGESGGAGLAGLIESALDSRSRGLLGLQRDSVAVSVNTEGATDRALYESLLARS
jgi:diaminopropionate ammonia-lyase